nr:transposase [Verminephrobacter aporrectodeae]
MDRKVFLVVDGHPAHKAKLIKSFVQDNADRLELFLLPPYSPELNPDELVWAHVKARVAKATVQTKDERNYSAPRPTAQPINQSKVGPERPERLG